MLCGLGAAGLILLLAAPPRGKPITLLPPPTALPSATIDEKAISPTQNISFGLLVNINTATLEELQQLPNIGPALAQAIIDYREAHGPFTSLEQLDDVPGIGPETYEALRPLITLGLP